MKKAALICVTRNNAEKLQTTLNSIIRNTNAAHYDLIIIDNASSDSTLGIYQLPILAENIKIVRSGKNLHRVGGINLGIEMTKGYQYVGFLNDDIEVCPNWLENFFDVLDCNPDVAAVGPLTSNARDWQGYDNVRKKLPGWGLPECAEIDRNNVSLMYDYTRSNGSGIAISGMLAFFCVLLKRNVIDEIGLLDSDFTEVYLGDDDDYCDRIKKSGYQLALSVRTYVAHYSGNSSKKTGDYNFRKTKADQLLEKKRARAEQKPSLQTPDISNKSLSSLMEMKSFWEPLMKVMPFYNYCAQLVSHSVPFSQFNSYVFNPGQKLALCTLYTSEIAAYAAESEKSILSYCIQNNYTAYIYRSKICNDIHPTWLKARVLLNHLTHHDAMVWLDVDTIILQQQKRVFENLLENPKPFHISRDLTDSGPTPYNAGVFLVKNTDWSFELLKDWDQFAQTHKPARLWDHGSDQKVLCDLILSKDPKREFHEVYEMSKFNTDPRNLNLETFLLHFMSYPKGYRIPWMHYWNANNLDFQESDFLDRIKPL